jgi:hypothetical protein
VFGLLVAEPARKPFIDHRVVRAPIGSGLWREINYSSEPVFHKIHKRDKERKKEQKRKKRRLLLSSHLSSSSHWLDTIRAPLLGGSLELLKTLNPQRRKRPMGHKYVGLDVHQSSTVAAVHDEQGKSMMESILATEAEAIRDFLKGLRGTIHVTFEEGTQAAWLYEIASQW